MKHIIVLSGAGISAESGLRTFRDAGGLWEGFDVMEVASIEGWKKNPQLVLDFYNKRRKDVLTAIPNKAHFMLAELEKQFRVSIITQNIDDLHERAGSSEILHLHGEIRKMRNTRDTEKLYDYSKDLQMGDLDPEGIQLRPHIVWFGEQVPMIEKAIPIIQQADSCIIIGTSLQVYPAAGLLAYFPDQVPVYIIDKNIPVLPDPKWIPIEKTASEGMEDLYRLLVH
jgi:NAD-dependent deacetylase